jgi:hypothetical protein
VASNTRWARSDSLSVGAPRPSFSQAYVRNQSVDRIENIAVEQIRLVVVNHDDCCLDILEDVEVLIRNPFTH